MKGTYFVIVVLHLFILHYFGILIGVNYSKASTIHKREVIKHVRFKHTRSGCTGSVYLYSTDNEKEIRVDSGKLQNIMKSRGRKSVIKKVNTRGVRLAKLEGSCCW